MKEERKQQVREAIPRIGEETEVMGENESGEISTEVSEENALEGVQVKDTEVSEEAVAETEKEADILYLGIDLGVVLQTC